MARRFDVTARRTFAGRASTPPSSHERSARGAALSPSSKPRSSRKTRNCRATRANAANSGARLANASGATWISASRSPPVEVCAALTAARKHGGFAHAACAPQQHVMRGVALRQPGDITRNQRLLRVDAT